MREDNGLIAVQVVSSLIIIIVIIIAIIHHNKHHHCEVHLRAVTQIRRMRLRPNFRRVEPMQRVQWSVFLNHNDLSWMMMMMVVEVTILKNLSLKMSILCGVISAILVVILVIAITMKIRFTFFTRVGETNPEDASPSRSSPTTISPSSSSCSPTLFSTILTIIVSRCGRRTEQTWRKDSSSESSFEISSKSPDLLVKDIQGGRRVDDESMNE